MWKVRAEIIGDFVIVEKFQNKDEAEEYADKLFMQGIWDSIKITFVGNEK